MSEPGGQAGRRARGQTCGSARQTGHFAPKPDGTGGPVLSQNGASYDTEGGDSGHLRRASRLGRDAGGTGWLLENGQAGTPSPIGHTSTHPASDHDRLTTSGRFGGGKVTIAGVAGLHAVPIVVPAAGQQQQGESNGAGENPGAGHAERGSGRRLAWSLTCHQSIRCPRRVQGRSACRPTFERGSMPHFTARVPVSARATPRGP